MAARAKEIDPIEQLARSVDLLLRLKLREVTGDRSQKDMILLMGEMGATSAEIASLLGINRTSVDPVLSKARASSTKVARSRRPAASRKV
jgi:DNA-directed RNA polymerase specialized sigma24 family protein